METVTFLSSGRRKSIKEEEEFIGTISLKNLVQNVIKKHPRMNRFFILFNMREKFIMMRHYKALLGDSGCGKISEEKELAKILNYFLVPKLHFVRKGSLASRVFKVCYLKARGEEETINSFLSNHSSRGTERFVFSNYIENGEYLLAIEVDFRP